MVHHDGRNLADASIELQHAFQGSGIALDIDVLYGDVALAEFLTGGRSVGSAKLTKDDYWTSHESILISLKPRAKREIWGASPVGSGTGGIF